MKTYKIGKLGAVGIAALLLGGELVQNRAEAQASLPLEPGQIVVTCFSGTSNNAVIPDPNNHVVGIIDTRDPLANGASLGSNWFTPPGFMFHNEGSPDEWFASKIGEVFGVTLDAASSPNIFLAATTVYGNFPAGPAGHGGIYRLDGTTGAISSTSISGIGNASLGNICHGMSSDGGSWLYVSSFEDGLIYRVNSVAMTVETASYDHGISGRAAAALAPIPDPGTADSLTPLGRRVWGVQVFENRLYYGVWWEDKSHPSAIDANEVWSVGLNPVTGEFLPATAQLEVTLPPRAASLNWSQPVASIDFSVSGAMLLAERYYRWDGVHQARVLEYTGTSGAWTASPINKYRVGNSSVLSAGGVVSDCEENVWSTGDILNGNIYGLHRIPVGGNATDAPATANSLLIDIDGDIVAQDKTLVGAVDLYKDCGCLVVDRIKVDCPREDGAPFELSLGLTNQSGKEAQWALLTPGDGVSAVSPSQIPLSPGIPDGGTFALTGINLEGAHSGEMACINVTLLTMVNGQLEECCTEKVQFELPDCECVALETASVECLAQAADGTVEAEVCFTVTNLEAMPLHHIFVLADPTLGVTPAPGYLPLSPPLAPGATETYCIKLSGLQAGQILKLPLTFHNEGLEECCLRELCIEVPKKDVNPQMPFCCRFPEVVYCCPNQGFAKALLVLCNKSEEDRELKWEVVPTPATPDCPVVLNPATDFTPNAGSMMVPAGECREVVVRVDCERLQNVQHPCALFGVMVEDPATGIREFCRSRVERTDDPTVKQLDPTSDDGTNPAIVDLVVGSRATIPVLVENGADEAFGGELVAVAESGGLVFVSPNGDSSSEWNQFVRLNPGQSRPFRLNVALNEALGDRLGELRHELLTAVHFFWRFPDRRTVLAATVPVRLLDPVVNVRPQARVLSLRSVQREDGNQGIEIHCEATSGKGIRLQMCENLEHSEWTDVSFAIDGEATVRERFQPTTDGTVKLAVPMAGRFCFFRIVEESTGAVE